MMIARIATLIALALMLASAALSGETRDGGSGPAVDPAKPTIEKLLIAGETFTLEVAADPASRAKGLMDRDKLDRGAGMIFIYPRLQSPLTFWMARCLIDIDVMFLDDRGRIVSVHRMKAEPPQGEAETDARYEARLKRYSSGKPAQFAIELSAGTLDRLELKPGLTIAMDLPRLKQLAKK